MKELRRFTSARVGLGRVGNGVPVREMLEFQLAHARARDAVHDSLDLRAFAELEVIAVRSAARDRGEYLRRPDLGRQLAPESRERLEREHGQFDVAFIIADGLSAGAVHRHAAEVLHLVFARLDSWRIAPVVVVEQGRVAIGDEIGTLLGAELAVVLIGERPGLSSPESMGVYLTWAPRLGRTDAERNCISNIHSEGLSTAAAAELLLFLMAEARNRRVSGVELKAPSQFRLTT